MVVVLCLLTLAVVQNGLERGIRVVPEVDMPGHAYSWGKGNANLTVYCSYYEENIDNIPLNPTLVYAV